ncbi:MAG: hypothetical protein Q8P05_02155 [Candidatus Diapherotrites archaeon]|nr:hypothetical protein [Candidatus Diapherotrites archaeon]MDZ4256448.1 hypothetical protein [archaeon]
MAAKTSIQVSMELKNELDKYKIYDRDTYEGVIWDLVEDHKMVNEETLKEIEQSRKEFREGKGIPHDEVKKRLNLR